MSAVIVKGILISLSVVAAVGVVLQQPEVRDWLEEQRRKIVELLRSVSEGLDADTRRQAEAFAFEGRLPNGQSENRDAIAMTSSRQMNGDTVERRLVRQNSADVVDAERQRLGREYLARRNQELLDMRRKRESGNASITDKKDSSESTHLLSSGNTGNTTPPSEQAIRLANAAANFDTMVNRSGSLRHEKQIEQSPSSSSEAATVVQTPAPVPGAFEAGAHFANPFGDEFASSDLISLDRSATPKPALPPKVPVSPVVPAQPINIPVEAVSQPEQSSHDPAYDEQLARALSLSLAENEATKRKALRRTLTEEEAFARAIAESLRDAEKAKAGPATPTAAAAVVAQSHEDAALSSNNPWRQRSEDEDLYTLTPMPTGQVRRSRILGGGAAVSLAAALREHAQREATNVDETASKTASPEVRPASPASATLSPLLTSRGNISNGFQTDSDSDTFASLPASSAQSVTSLVEVEDVGIESMDDDDDGIATPSEWSEISSQVGEHDHSESESEQPLRL